MKPIENEATNFTFRLPGGTEANDLPVRRDRWPDGSPTIKSYWEPTDAERECVADGGVVTLTVFGSGHPPVLVEALPGAAQDPDAPGARDLLRMALAADQEAQQWGRVGAFSDEFRAELQSFLGLETI